MCNLNFRKTYLIKGSGVDLQFYKPLKNESDSKNILFASRLLKSKGLLEFVESAKVMNSKKCNFLVAGMLDKENPDCVSEELINGWVRDGIIKYCDI